MNTELLNLFLEVSPGGRCEFTRPLPSTSVLQLAQKFVNFRSCPLRFKERTTFGFEFFKYPAKAPKTGACDEETLSEVSLTGQHLLASLDHFPMIEAEHVLEHRALHSL